MKKMKIKGIYIVFLLALGIRILLACICRGFLTDIGCFYSWAVRVFEEGFATFYTSGQFSDYPPGYIVILYGIGALIKLFKVKYLSFGCLLLVKLPAIVCDMALGGLIYAICRGRVEERRRILYSCLYLFNPAVLLNSVVWGQTDSVFTFLVVIMCLLLMKKQTIPSYFVYVLGVLIKPQTIIFTPLLLLGIYENEFSKGINVRRFFMNLFGGILAIDAGLLVCVPFGLENIWNLYTGTLGSYPYVAVNAYNFWGMFGLNWVSQEDKIFGLLSYANVGKIVIVAICILSVIIFRKYREKESCYFVTGAFIIITMYLFSVRMHERYLYPAMIFMLLFYVMQNKKKILANYMVVSAFHFLNVWHVLKYYDPQNYNRTALPIVVISVGIVAAGFWTYMIIFSSQREEKEAVSFGKYYFGSVAPCKPVPDMKFGKKDLLYILSITLFYGLFAFYQLGSTKVPCSEYTTIPGENIMLTIPEGENVSTVTAYLAYEHDVQMGAWKWDFVDSQWISVGNQELKNVYQWNETMLSTPVNGYLCFIMDSQERHIGEMVLRNTDGEIILPENYQDFPELFDEQSLFPEDTSYLYNTYFDEIYYTRTIKDMLSGNRTYEWTHPPFGKVLMTIGVLLFGENPLGFRFIGTLIGCLMLPVLYLLARNLLRSREAGAFVAFIFAFDFMHFTQTRITTIDVYVTFFVIVMYYFMEKYLRHNFHEEPLKKTLVPLGACGVAFGFGIASKWTGFFAGGGLAVLFFGACFKRVRESYYLYEQEGKKGKFLKGTQFRECREKLLKTWLFCIVFFILVPFVIYTLSYIPFRGDNASAGLVQRMWENQSAMLSYHEGVTSPHPYASRWYEWPTMIRPCLYEVSNVSDTLVRGISAFGNPLIFWMGIPAFFVMVYWGIRKKDKVAWFLCIGYLAQYLPWMFVGRCTFIYHYFPSVPFLALMLGHIFNSPLGIYRRNKKIKPLIMIAYGGAVFLLFLLFYPVLSGAAIDREYVKESLRWLSGWVLVI